MAFSSEATFYLCWLDACGQQRISDRGWSWDEAREQRRALSNLLKIPYTAFWYEVRP